MVHGVWGSFMPWICTSGEDGEEGRTAEINEMYSGVYRNT